MGAERAIRQELPCMAFHTPHGSARYRLPWSWSAFDYRELCRALWEQCGDAEFHVAKVDGRTGHTVHTDRGDLTAPLIVDALGWRRVLGPGPNVQPPDALISRGLEVHPHDARGADLDIWIERDVVRRGIGGGEGVRPGVLGPAEQLHLLQCEPGLRMVGLGVQDVDDHDGGAQPRIDLRAPHHRLERVHLARSARHRIRLLGHGRPPRPSVVGLSVGGPIASRHRRPRWRRTARYR